MVVALDVEQVFDVEQPKDVEQAQRGGTGPKRWNRPKNQPYLFSRQGGEGGEGRRKLGTLQRCHVARLSPYGHAQR